MMPPPMFYPPPPPPRREKSFARTIFMTLAAAIFSISLAVNGYLLLFSGIMDLGSSKSLEQTERIGDPKQRIAVIPIEGPIFDGTAVMVNGWLRQAEQDPNVKAIVLTVNTPGGSVTASDEIYYRIEQVKKNRGIPIVVSMGGMATSGGYYVSCAADQIFAQPMTLTGNIGVIMPRYNLADLAKKWGIAESTLTAPPQGFKNAGSMFAPEDPKDTAYLQGIIDGAYARFTSLVTKGRQGKLTKPHSELFNGAAFLGEVAKANGLVDQIGRREDAIDWAAKQAGLLRPTVVRFQRRSSFLEALSVKYGGPTVSNGGMSVNVNIDAAALEQLNARTPLYMPK
jgi:signal peptide peptidase SppA